ncbi:LysM domain-containing protein [Beggiatoa alba B18LD]|uniref:LysM domain-containing protein n=1 Tax=Beggiatoa alba B18LD TaxID=395493 RepID=I3CDH1_9GAMM|nr:LysM domain-containing protein [Beggiatoa alba]EIJ41664.1 LysM domain-containing protein [Beggiatoa alba B18LD]
MLLENQVKSLIVVCGLSLAFLGGCSSTKEADVPPSAPKTEVPAPVVETPAPAPAPEPMPPVVETPAPVEVTTETHTVVKGDTVYNIAKRYGRTVTEIARWNSIKSPYTIKIGQVLKVAP